MVGECRQQKVVSSDEVCSRGAHSCSRTCRVNVYSMELKSDLAQAQAHTAAVVRCKGGEEMNTFYLTTIVNLIVYNWCWLPYSVDNQWIGYWRFDTTGVDPYRIVWDAGETVERKSVKHG